MRRNERAVTDAPGISAILDLCKTCHVAMVDDNTPYVVPLSFGYTLENGVLTLFFHSAKEGRKLDILRKNSRVCFEMCAEGELIREEAPCEWGYYYASLIGWGEVSFIEDDEEKCRALSKVFVHQSGREVTFTPQQTKSVCVYKIVSTEFTGKRKPRPGN